MVRHLFGSISILIFFTIIHSQGSDSRSLVDKCAYNSSSPQFSCDMYIGEWIVYDSKQGRCITVTGGCSVESVRKYSFSTMAECQTTCKSPPGVTRPVVITPQPPIARRTIPPVLGAQRCSYSVPLYMCLMYIENLPSFIVYDSKTRQCVWHSDPCQNDVVEAYSFSSKDECEATCLHRGTTTTTKLVTSTPQSTVTTQPIVTVVNKCQFVPSKAVCPIIDFVPFPSFIVYDSEQGQCVNYSNACEMERVMANSFASLQECQAKCEPHVPLLGVSMHSKCSYQIPEITCQMYIGEFIVFDSKTGQCTIQSSGCDAKSVARYAFASLAECETACLGS